MDTYYLKYSAANIGLYHCHTTSVFTKGLGPDLNFCLKMNISLWSYDTENYCGYITGLGLAQFQGVKLNFEIEWEELHSDLQSNFDRGCPGQLCPA